MLQTPKYSIELLAPARNESTAIAAINNGADAVYIGASTHGARAAAGNSVADIAGVCEYAHRFDARVYVTVNTLVYESELRAVERLIGELYAAGVDALIVQDLSLLRMTLPPIALHASTQCDIRTPEKARFYESLGFSQLVLPRELTLDEISQMRRAVKVPLEGFVHGALCVSYSGDCRASLLNGGRSANRGECAQICRLPFDLTDGNGKVVMAGKHLLSLRDLNRLDVLGDLINAGISSLKIEGRLKDEAYVKNIVSAYDRELRRLGVARTSSGVVERTFTPDPERSFNRGFTRHFLTTASPAASTLASFDSPKSLGPEIATVVSVRGKRLTVKDLAAPLANGDGLAFVSPAGTVGFRVNRFEAPSTILTAEVVGALKPGLRLHRSFDKAFVDSLTPATAAVRFIPLKLTLRRVGDSILLEQPDGAAASIVFAKAEPAKTPQAEARKRVIAKLGDTPYRLEELTDCLGDEFIPASVLTGLRREFVAALDASRRCRFERPLRLNENPDAQWPEGNSLDFHANVANSLAEKVYRDHGVCGPIEPAWETALPAPGQHRVMTTRYCLRRELGACLKTPAGRNLAEPLTLSSPNLAAPLRLQFDCANCRCQVITESSINNTK
ncbi:MAG: U32 family peptidase [Muribaculaceae bacterium]|nr:U32 family peptidase [Muribaculaceae bacterium]